MLISAEAHLTTGEAGKALGLSIGTIKKLVQSGVLTAKRTPGGHLRVMTSSINTYREAYLYSNANISPITQTAGLICIIHYGGDLDPMLVQNHDPEFICLMSNPLDLLSIKEKIISLFIDARNQWLQTISDDLLTELCGKYQVYIYNSETLASNSRFYQMTAIKLISISLNLNFISGFLVGGAIQKTPPPPRICTSFHESSPSPRMMKKTSGWRSQW